MLYALRSAQPPTPAAFELMSGPPPSGFLSFLSPVLFRAHRLFFLIIVLPRTGPFPFIYHRCALGRASKDPGHLSPLVVTFFRSASLMSFPFLPFRCTAGVPPCLPPKTGLHGRSFPPPPSFESPATFLYLLPNPPTFGFWTGILVRAWVSVAFSVFSFFCPLTIFAPDFDPLTRGPPLSTRLKQKAPLLSIFPAQSSPSSFVFPPFYAPPPAPHKFCRLVLTISFFLVVLLFFFPRRGIFLPLFYRPFPNP